MAEQNILSADQSVLEQILSDINEYEENQERLEYISASIKDITKETDSTSKAMQDEISARIKESTDAICAGYDKAIDCDKDKIKQVQADRDKAKQQGMKERIQTETASLRQENKELASQIERAFIQENISKITNNTFFLALFLSRKLKDVLVYILFMLIMCGGIPAVLYVLPFVPVWVPVVYTAVIALLFLIISRCVYINLIMPHYNTIIAARDTKYRIRNNKKIIKKIRHSIKKDDNDAIYGLESFDHKINDLHDSIEKTENENQGALKEFEETVKPDILEEIQGRYVDKLELMNRELTKKKDEYTKLDDLVKQQRIYISSNYEAYIGKEFVDKEKLAELCNIMKSGACTTIAQAIAEYKNQH